MAATNASLATITVRCDPLPTHTAKSLPSHWTSTSPTGYRNPWPSFRMNGLLRNTIYFMLNDLRKFPAVPPKNAVPVRTPTWGVGTQSAGGIGAKATWLGHACFLLELEKGGKILFDPVFSDRCSPSQHLGPKRFTGEFGTHPRHTTYRRTNPRHAM